MNYDDKDLEELLNFEYKNHNPEKAAREAREAELRRRAQQEAYERYRIKSERRKPSGFRKFAKGLSWVYLAVLAAFVIIMTVMNVFPAGMLIVFYVAFGLLSLLLFLQLNRRNIKKWARVAACVVSILLIGVYGIGSAYALGTLSFLNSTSVKNDHRVARISEEPFNVIVTGMDVLGTIDTQGRSDVNMVITVNPKTATILMTSIPRDYEIRMPEFGYATDKLTHTGFYSVQTTVGSIDDLLDIDANYYVKVNFSTVIRFVNAVGGVDVYSEYEFVPEKMPDWTVQKGINHMSGSKALAFARERHSFETGDNQRIRNQQAVLEAVIKKATSSKTMILNYNKILSKLNDYFEMSFSSAELRSLVKLQLAKNPKWKIYKTALYGYGASKETYTGGSQPLYVMEGDYDSIANGKMLIQAVMDGQKLDKNKKGEVFLAKDQGDDSGAGAEGEEDAEDAES